MYYNPSRQLNGRLTHVTSGYQAQHTRKSERNSTWKLKEFDI